ncbi:4'-phosphopantetheinyl transferase superfamily protein [Streptomyces sp. adm13(2018)]|nr:4'-phosphopantetheinyl transferase superfamily protein [Streptomyces sp. adm13(2018)]
MEMSPGRPDILVVCATTAAAAAHAPLLSSEELRRARRYAPHRAQEFTAGRALLRWALERSLGRWTRTCRIGATDRGKPVLVDLPDTGISVSHSQGTIAVAVAGGRTVGIDVQGPVPPTPGLLRRCCSPAQQRELAALPAERQDVAVARRWAIHEACAKATGTTPINLPAPHPGPLLADSGSRRGLRWRVLHPLHGAAVCVAYDERPRPPATLAVALLAPHRAPGSPTHPPEDGPTSR